MRKRPAPVSAFPALPARRFKLAQYRDPERAEVIDPEERKRVAAGLAALAASLTTRQSNALDRQYGDRPLVAEIADQYRATPPTIGPHLAELIAHWHEKGSAL